MFNRKVGATAEAGWLPAVSQGNGVTEVTFIKGESKFFKEGSISQLEPPFSWARSIAC